LTTPGKKATIFFYSIFTISIFILFLQGVSGWHHGSDFGRQIKFLLDFGKAEMENSDLPSYVKREKYFIHLDISKYRSFLVIQKRHVFLATINYILIK